MSSLGARHPDDGELLRYSDGELPACRLKEIEAHLAACWQCRAELNSINRTIGECVRYDRTVLQSHLPNPPASWRDIRPHLARLDEAGVSPAVRLWNSLRPGFARPRRWAIAATIILAAVLAIDQLRNTPSVQAAELLDKAIAAAGSQPAAARRILIRTGLRRVTRDIGGLRHAARSAEDARFLASLKPLFDGVRYGWDDPLSAASFASWRNALADKSDEVTTVGHPQAPGRKCLRIRTTTGSSDLASATLLLEVEGLRPVGCGLHFRGRDPIEITLAPHVPRPAPISAASASPSARPSSPRPPTPPVATAADELKVFAALRRLGADLGEPVEVGRGASEIVVTGIGIAPELERLIQGELQGMARVTLRFKDPPSTQFPTGRAAESASLPPDATRLQTEMERVVGGRSAYETFTSQSLAAGEAAMARVYALRRLAQRFPAGIESTLNAAERGQLRSLRHEHALALSETSANLENRVRAVIPALGARPEAGTSRLSPEGTWQSATEELFHQARQAESVLAALIGGADPPFPRAELPARVAIELADFRATTAQYLLKKLE